MPPLKQVEVVSCTLLSHIHYDIVTGGSQVYKTYHKQKVCMCPAYIYT